MDLKTVEGGGLGPNISRLENCWGEGMPTNFMDLKKCWLGGGGYAKIFYGLE